MIAALPRNTRILLADRPVNRLVDPRDFKIDSADVLTYLLEQISDAPDETVARHILHPSAA